MKSCVSLSLQDTLHLYYTESYISIFNSDAPFDNHLWLLIQWSSVTELLNLATGNDDEILRFIHEHQQPHDMIWGSAIHSLREASFIGPILFVSGLQMIYLN